MGDRGGSSPFIRTGIASRLYKQGFGLFFCPFLKLAEIWFYDIIKKVQEQITFVLKGFVMVMYRGNNKGTGIIAEMKKGILVGCLLVGCLMLASCSNKKEKKAESPTPAPTEKVEQSAKPVVFEEDGESFEKVEEYVYTTTKLNVRKSCSTDSEVVKMLPERAKVMRIGVGETWSKIRIDEGEYYVATEYLTQAEPVVDGHLIAIDAGHQETANTEEEAIGPGASKKKAKATIGTSGVSTGKKEYELTLEVAKKLKEELTQRGYSVFMVRESNDVNLSPHERADMAKEAGAEVLVRLHANGSKIKETNGAMAICGTKNSPYVASLYDDSYRLSKDILTHFVKETGANNKGVWQTDLMAGINWSSMPVTILEMGFMSNAQEDQKLSDADYQTKMIKGIADGLDAYFE